MSILMKVLVLLIASVVASAVANSSTVLVKQASQDIRSNTYHQLLTMDGEREAQSRQNLWQAGERLARSLGSGGSSREVRALAQGSASALGESMIQQALSQYGTARLRLNFNEQDGFDGSEFDFLYPLYETPSQVTFTQLGIRHLDARTMSTLGMGQRFWLYDDMMLGYNSFWDHDITRGHSRIGVGIEYARDYLRLSSNGYFRLTGWQTSYDLRDYQERVANGVDVRVESWLPVYPQLGGTLAYTQFYGDHVGIFGPDVLQKDPQILSIGLNVTPIPLLGLRFEQALNLKGGTNETTVSLALRYQFGVPLAQQLDSQRVGMQRTLAGMRYDLVDRNNKIILEYKQDRLFNLPTYYHLSGREAETLLVDLPLSSKYVIVGVVWDGSGYFTAGGRVDYRDGHYQFTLPEWDSLGENRYTLTGRAIDSVGNISQPFSLSIEVLAMPVKISLAGEIKGEEGERVPLGLNARMEGEIAEVNWNAPAFLAAGGQFIQQKPVSSDSYSLNYYALLPPYQRGESNRYPIEVSVKDSAGNVSNNASGSVVIEARSLSLTLPERLAGVEGHRLIVPLAVQSKLPISHYIWQAEAFLAQGGQIAELSKQELMLTLPPWSAMVSNQYPLTLTAVDSEGRTSAAASTTIVVSSVERYLTVDSAISGKSGTVVLLAPTLSGGSRLARMTWQAEAFLAQGGRIDPLPDGRYALKLPLWSAQHKNHYTIAATAYDEQGRQSNTVDIAVEVLPVSIGVKQPEQLAGVEQSTVALTLVVQADDPDGLSAHFDASAFLQAGGQITGTLPDYQLHLPEWQPGNNNSYVLTVVVQDKQGNRSEAQATNLSVSQAAVTLATDNPIQGHGGQSVSLPLTVDSLYGIDSYRIEADEFKRAGGNAAINGDELQLLLPTFVVGETNRYNINLEAIDLKGTRSNRLTLSVLVTTPLPGDVTQQCSVIGGGAGYRGTIDKSTVSYHVATDYHSLKKLVDQGAEYIYIPRDVEIEIPLVENALVVKSGTTIFGDRGSDGSEGGKLRVEYVDEKDYHFPVIRMEGDTRMTGLRYIGPYSGTTTNNTTIGIQTVPGSRNIEVDNMELAGWPWAAVSVRTATNVRVHSNYIHDNIKSNWGYGVVTQNGNAEAEIMCNIFDSNRHAIAGNGQSGEGYSAHHNLVLNGGGRGAYHQFDMHGFGPNNIAGEYMLVSYNWFDFGRLGTSNRSSIMVNGQPEGGPIVVENNWFSQGWQVGSQQAVDGKGHWGLWVPTVERIQADNAFNVNFRYLDKRDTQCTVDWLSYSQSINCAGVASYVYGLTPKP
ncbi:Attaching and effacing protein [Edwardsiella tarda]|nr:Attaching and effacing protein [Edwardsiella tarda]